MTRKRNSITRNIRRFAACMAMLLWGVSLRAADTTAVYPVYFYVDQSDLAPELRMNRRTLADLDHTLDSLLVNHVPVRVEVRSGASPEGTEEKNLQLSRERSARLRLYLLTHHPRLEERDLMVTSFGADWDGLQRALERTRFSWTERAIRIIRNTPIWVRNRAGQIVDSRKKQLMDLQGGQAWRSMEMDIFPTLRRSVISVSYPLPAVAPAPPAEPRTDTVYVVEHKVDTVTLEKRITVPPIQKKFAFQIYSNLLYDIATVLSLGVEFNFGKGWAVNARWSGSWWDNAYSNRYWRIYGGELAVRKYLSPREPRGHHFGAYGQILTYDIEFSGRGYLGGIPGRNMFSNPTWSAGLEYGYMLPIGRHLGLDFSLGIGYLQGMQRIYFPQGEGGYVQEGERLFRWIGPTRADVSLYWLFGMEHKRKGKGGRR